ncbi:hypothetical protein [Prosthecobacter sp.]|uniref:hypothetical protein n=1 Tax=Prosthecobacter sp. TaxID=1965333 RepID=UPI002ABB0C11|nr:hypothetical protein [Prosthecobacter sp.]MDZ4403942.1 hypothetical protein [Prosthecobacter sp.]
MSYIPGTIKAARLKQPRLTTEQVWQQVERHLGISLTRPACSENGDCGMEPSLKETPSHYQADGPEWSTK